MGGIPGSDLLGDFESSRDETEIVKVLKELFDKDKISLITDLDDDEIRLVTQILMIAELKDNPGMKLGVTYFTQLLLSRKRKSRTEIIDAIKGYGEKFKRGFGSMMGVSQQGGLR